MRQPRTHDAHGQVGCESETHALPLTYIAPARKTLLAKLRHFASDWPVMIASLEALRFVSKVRVHVTADELSSTFFPAAVLTASRSLRYPSTSEGGQTTYTVTDGIQHNTALTLERVRRMEHLVGGAAAAAIDQRGFSTKFPHGAWHWAAWQVALRHGGRTSHTGRVRGCHSEGWLPHAAHFCVLL